MVAIAEYAAHDVVDSAVSLATEVALRPWWESSLLRRDDRFQERWVKLVRAFEANGVVYPESGQRAFIQLRDGPGDDGEFFYKTISFAEIRDDGCDRSTSPVGLERDNLEKSDLIYAITSDGDILTGDDSYILISDDTQIVYWCRSGESRWRPGYTCPVTKKPKVAKVAKGIKTNNVIKVPKVAAETTVVKSGRGMFGVIS